MTRISRRKLLAGMSTVAAIAALPAEGKADQPHMEAALAALRNAERELRDATPDKGGYRGRAMRMVRDAIREVERGVEWARKH